MKGLVLAIVVVQLVCHLPRTGLNIYEMVMVCEQAINGDNNTDAGFQRPPNLLGPALVD